MLCEKGTIDDLKRNFIFQKKYDGERCFLIKRKGEILLLNRNRENVTYRYPEIYTKQKDDFVLDGEIVASDFNSLAKRTHLKDRFEIQKRKFEIPVTFMAFDILKWNNVELTIMPLKQRLKFLDCVYETKNIKKAECYTNGIELWSNVLEQDLEGVIAKDPESPYLLMKRSKYWLKIKNWKECKVRFTSFETNPDNSFTLTDGNHRVKCCDTTAIDLIKVFGYVDVEIQFLEITENSKYRMPHMKCIAKG